MENELKSIDENVICFLFESSEIEKKTFNPFYMCTNYMGFGIEASTIDCISFWDRKLHWDIVEHWGKWKITRNFSIS